MSISVSSNVLAKRSEEEADEFVKANNPSLQMRLAKLPPERAYFGNSPTLATLNREYGAQMAEMWLTPQIHDLNEYAGVNGKMNGMQKEQLATLMASECYYLKVSELMLFFLNFKKGKYGQFYGVVDPIKVMSALETFKQDRAMAYRKQEMEEARKRREDTTGCMTADEWQWFKAVNLHKALRTVHWRGPVGRRLRAGLRTATKQKPIRLKGYEDIYEH